MIQVCSQCGTRWNVRDRERSWCPRCGGTLLAPGASPPQGAAAAASPSRPDAPRLAPGYRWIAVRPGAAPPARRPRGPLGPTPRYRTIPSWGLYQPFDVPDQPADTHRRGPRASTVRLLLVLTMIALAIAASMHVLRYVLLLINRGVLLHPAVAWGGILLGVVASVIVLIILPITVVALISWLVARRSEAYAQQGDDDPRSSAELWICCLLPLVNLVMAPVFVLELARADNRLSQLRRPIVVWWIVWVFSALLAGWSSFSTVRVTFFVNTPQNIADNTVMVTVGYLLALATVLLVTRVFNGFERTTTVERTVRRWVVVGTQATPAAAPARPAEGEAVTDPAGDSAIDEVERDQQQSAAPVESEGQNPAA